MADGVENQAEVAQAGKALGEGLVGFSGFAVRGVATSADDGRERAPALFRNVNVGGDQKVGAALEDKILDGVCVAIDGAGNFRLEWGFIPWEWREGGKDTFSDFGDISFSFVLRCESVLASEAAAFSANDLFKDMVMNHAGEAMKGSEVVSGKDAVGMICERKTEYVKAGKTEGGAARELHDLGMFPIGFVN